MSKIAIDCGTSKLLAYEYDEEMNEFYSLTQDEINGMPALFAYSNNGEVLVGNKVTNLLTLEPQNVVHSIKTKLNESSITVNGKTFTSEEILDYITKEHANEIKNKFQLNHFLTKELQEAVLTVPVPFGNYERTIEKRCYERNGIKIKDIVTEPVAAGTFLRNKFKELKRLAVSDIGAGTMDLCALDVINHDFVIKDVQGNYFAGDKFDEAILNYLYANGKLNSNKSEVDKQIDLLEVKEMKEKLSFHDTWSKRINYQNQTPVLLTLTQKDIECALSSIFDEIIQELSKFIEKNYQENMHLLLTGRSSLIPSLQKRIKESIQNKKITCHFYDTSIIAKGAALYAKKQVNVSNFMVKYHYCLSIFDDDVLVLSNLVPAKVELPYTKTFHLRKRGNHGALFNIYEVDQEYRDKYLESITPKKLATTFTEHTPFEHNTPIEFIVHVDKNGLLTMKYNILNLSKEKQLQL